MKLRLCAYYICFAYTKCWKLDGSRGRVCPVSQESESQVRHWLCIISPHRFLRRINNRKTAEPLLCWQRHKFFQPDSNLYKLSGVQCLSLIADKRQLFFSCCIRAVVMCGLSWLAPFQKEVVQNADKPHVVVCRLQLLVGCFHHSIPQAAMRLKNISKKLNWSLHFTLNCKSLLTKLKENCLWRKAGNWGIQKHL